MPRRFVFRLQPVLEQRERFERECKVRMGELERERISIEARIRGYQEQITDAKKELREQVSGALDGRVRIDAVRLQSSASLHMIARAHQAVLELAGVHRRMDGARAELARAAAARKAVSRLKEKQTAEWRLGVAKHEAAELDELAVIGHKRAGERQ